MTDEELKALVAGLAVAQAETDRLLKTSAEEMREFRRTQEQANLDLRQTLKETDRRLNASAEETREFRVDLRQTIEETDRRLNASAEEMREFREEMRRTIKELGRQVGGLGNKFGDFAEGMALPSLEDILAKRFGVEHFVETKRARKGEDEIELDLLGATDGRSKTVVAAEVKSVLNQRELEKFVRNLRRFFEFFPQFKGYKLYGVLAAVDSSRETDQAAQAQGIAVARMHGDIFRLKVPASFRPKDYSS